MLREEDRVVARDTPANGAPVATGTGALALVVGYIPGMLPFEYLPEVMQAPPFSVTVVRAAVVAAKGFVKVRALAILEKTEDTFKFSSLVASWHWA